MSSQHPSEPLRLYWWAKKKNFGDLIGPWLAAMISGRPTVNIRDASHDQVGLATAGSLVHSLDRPGLSIWGSGSICSLQTSHIEALLTRKPAAIHALRGWKTYKEVTTKLGWKAPKVYGDPAMLLPRFYRPKPRTDVNGKIAVVPHYTHKKQFESLPDEAVHVIDVQDDPDTVVDQIAASHHCLSSSLHGIVVAQAYGIPWVWLRISGERLLGGDFKFEDFFTVIDRASVRVATIDPVSATGPCIRALADFAYLPKNKFTFTPLLESFPYRSVETGPFDDAGSAAHFDTRSDTHVSG